MADLAPTARIATVGVRHTLMASAAKLGKVRVSGAAVDDAGAAPKPAPAPQPAPKPAPGEEQTDAPPAAGEPDAAPAETDPKKPKQPEKADLPGSDVADVEQPADPAEVVEACAAVGLPTLASGFIRARMSMAAVKARLPINGAEIHARFNARPALVAAAASVPARSTRLDSSAIFVRLNTGR